MTDHMQKPYPFNKAEGQELYDDLRDFAGLSHDAAVETVGFAVVQQLCMITDIGSGLSLGGFIDVYPFSNESDRESYERGASLGAQEFVGMRGSNV